MHYLIDGYNLFFKLHKNILPLNVKRDEFLTDLDLEITELNLNATLIFDSHKEHAQVFPSLKKMKRLDIVFSPKHLTADEYILELLSWNNKNTTLVTSDQGLSLKASHLGARTHSVEDFINLILRKRHQKTGKTKFKPELQESDAHLTRLLKIFEKRLLEDENA